MRRTVIGLRGPRVNERTSMDSPRDDHQRRAQPAEPRETAGTVAAGVKPRHLVAGLEKPPRGGKRDVRQLARDGE